MTYTLRIEHGSFASFWQGGFRRYGERVRLVVTVDGEWLTLRKWELLRDEEKSSLDDYAYRLERLKPYADVRIIEVTDTRHLDTLNQILSTSMLPLSVLQELTAIDAEHKDVEEP